MRKQTKLVAVLSTAALLAIGASMTSFAAVGWAEEDGTWVYYDRNEERVTNQWARSGNNWYYLDDNGEMAVDQLIEDNNDRYYYVDASGAMVTNQWVAIDNEDAGDDDEPDQHWYYFQANGRALTNGNSSRVSLKTVNGKRYAFDDEGKMLWGWVSEDNAEHIDNTDGDAFLSGVYYFGDANDGALTTGWLQMDITYDDATSDEFIAPAFSEDEDQTRWFYFMSNGKKVAADEGDSQKERTINGRRYAFDVNGAMTAEWSLDTEKATASQPTASTSAAEQARYSQAWRYFNSVEDGSRVSNGWFRVVPAEMLDQDRYDDDEDNWYYADGRGNLYAGEFRTINGRRYAFRNDGRMVSGLRFILRTDDSITVMDDDHDTYGYDNEDDFDANAATLEGMGYRSYYFGDMSDGSLKTGRTTVSLDGENTTFFFERSGSKRGAGVTGEEDDRYYQSGKLLTAGSDEKYQVIHRTRVDGPVENVDSYALVDDVETLLSSMEEGRDYIEVNVNDEAAADAAIAAANIRALNKDAEDLRELYLFNVDSSGEADGLALNTYFLVNTSGRFVDSRGRSRDGNDYYFVTNDNGKIMAIYLED